MADKFDLESISWVKKTPGVAPQVGHGARSTAPEGRGLSERQLDSAAREILTNLLDVSDSSKVVEVVFTPLDASQPRQVYQLRARTVR